MRTFGRTKRNRRRKIAKQISQPNFAHIYSLLKWMSGHGFRLNTKLKPAEFEGTGRGLMCRKAIRKEDVIVAIPQCLFITAASAQAYLKQYPSELLKDTTEENLLCIFLVCQSLLGAASVWQPYVKTLPEYYSGPSGLEPRYSQLHRLPRDLREQVFCQREAMEDTYKRLQPLLSVLYQEMGVKACSDRKLFDWAWNSVQTRCVHLEGYDGLTKVALLPFLDLLNHSVHAKIRTSYNKNSKHFEIISCENIKRYQQVFIHYGNHDNRNLFLHYGFVIPGNPNDLIPICQEDFWSCPDILSSFCHQDCTQIRMETFRQWNYFENCGICWEGLTWNLKLLLTLLVLSCDGRTSKASSEEELTWAIQNCDSYLREDLARCLLDHKLQSYPKYLDRQQKQQGTSFASLLMLIDNEKEMLLKAIKLYSQNKANSQSGVTQVTQCL